MSDYKEKKNPSDVDLKTAPNMLEVNVVYSFNLNPSDTHQCLGEYKTKTSRFYRVHKYFRKVFQSFNWEYELYPEISTPHDGKRIPRVHYHGFVCFRNIEQILEWYDTIHVRLKGLTMFEMDSWDGKQKYLNYCKKNHVLMEAICEHVNLTYQTKSQHMAKCMINYIKQRKLESPDSSPSDS